MSRTAKQIAAQVKEAHPSALSVTPSSTVHDPSCIDRLLVTQPDPTGYAGDYEVVIYSLDEAITLQKARGVERAVRAH